MPKVPQLNGPQVQRAAFQPVRVDENISREAANIGPSRLKLDNTIYDLAEKAKSSADQVAVMEAENELVSFENDFQYNPETGMFRKEGKDAFDLIEVSKEQYDKQRSDISNKLLKNDIQRGEFNMRADRRREQFDKTVMNHVGVQIKKYDDDVTSATFKLEKNKAVNGYQDPDVVAGSLANQAKAALEYSDRHGESREQAQLRVQTLHSETHTGIIDRIINNGDDQMAESYFKANEASFVADDKTKVLQWLDISSTRGKAQRFADEVMAKGLDQGAAMKEAEKTFGDNPKVRQAAEERVDRMFNIKKQVDNERQENIYNYAVKKFNETGTLDDLDPKVVAAMKPATQRALRSFADDNPIRDDGKMFYQLKKMAADPATRKKFLDHELLNEKPHLSQAHFEQLTNLQQELKAGKKDTEKKMDGFLSDTQTVEDMFRQATNEKADETNDNYLKYRSAVDQEVERVKRQQDRDFVSNEEIRNISKNYLTELVVKKRSFWSDKTMKKFEISPSDIPEAEAQNIKAALKKTGRPATDENVLLYYIKSKEKELRDAKKAN